MTTGTHRAVSMFTACCASDASEAAARRTGFVQRTSTLTGQLVLARVTCGAWRDATTTLAPLAAQATPWDAQVAVSPEAIPPRLHRRARAFRQDRLPRARATGQGGAHVCEDGLCTDFTKVSLAERTGCALPDSRHDLLPGSGGSAAKAGAKIQAVWDDKSSVLGHFALTPWNIPDQTYVATVVALAQKGVLFLFD